MKDILIRFTRNLAIISSLVAAAGVSVYLLLPQFVTPALPFLVLLFILTTFSLFYLMIRASSGKFNTFANYFMVASMLKILLLILLLSLYAFFFRSDAILFTVTLFILYTIYTIFEVFWLLRINKTK